MRQRCRRTFPSRFASNPPRSNCAATRRKLVSCHPRKTSFGMRGPSAPCREYDGLCGFAPAEKLGRRRSTTQMPYRFSSLFALIAALVMGFAFVPTLSLAAEAAPGVATAEHETLSLKPARLFHLGKFTVTNSMLLTWLVAVGIIVFE